MLVAIIADIHANLPALEAVLAEIDRRGNVDAVFHAGDLVGYAPFPNETVALIRERGIAGVSGNYDSTVAMRYKHCGCKYEDPRQEELSHLSFAWTVAHVSEDTRKLLEALPFRLDIKPLGGHVPGPSLTLVHGTPLNNLTYWTEDRSDAFCTKMADVAGAKAGDVIAFGHTHIPWHRVVNGVHFVNAGSVGRPKDGEPRAAYALINFAQTRSTATTTSRNRDETSGPAGPVSVGGLGNTGKSGPSVQFIRVEYDVERTALAIDRSQLPNDFAGYLRTGGNTR